MSMVAFHSEFVSLFLSPISSGRHAYDVYLLTTVIARYVMWSFTGPPSKLGTAFLIALSQRLRASSCVVELRVKFLRCQCVYVRFLRYLTKFR